MIRTYRYRLYPTQQQKLLLDKTLGCCRYVYNRALALKKESPIVEGKGIRIREIAAQMTQWKKDEQTKWLSEVSAQALQASLRDLDTVFTSFYKGTCNYPTFRTRRKSQSFRSPQDTKIDFKQQRIYIPKFKEGIKIVVSRQFDPLAIKTSTVIKTSTGKYFVSLWVSIAQDLPSTSTPTSTKTIGLDLGIKSFVTDSDGDKTDAPKPLRHYLNRLSRAQRRMTNRVKGSANREKARHRVATIHERITNIRKDFLHKLTKRLVENQDYDSFAIEALSVQDMIKNADSRAIARSIGDVSWYEFRRQLTYKAAWGGKNVLVIGRFEPSSKTCDKCEKINHDLTLADRTWTCACGATHDRDILAARNIKRIALRNLVPLAKRELTPMESLSGSMKWEDKPFLNIGLGSNGVIANGF